MVASGKGVSRFFKRAAGKPSRHTGDLIRLISVPFTRRPCVVCSLLDGSEDIVRLLLDLEGFGDAEKLEWLECV